MLGLKSPCLNCAIVAWSMWPELACMFLPIHWSVHEQQQCECEWNCCCLLYLQGNSLTYFDWTAFFKLCLFWLELACMFLPIHWSVHEQQQRVVNVSETVVVFYICKVTHSRTLIELLSLNCAFFWLELACMFLPIHWSVHEQRQRVVNVSETVVVFYICKATHSLVYFDWSAFFKLCLFLTGACVRVPSHPLICVWAATKGCECEWNCCWRRQLQGNSLTCVL